MRLALTILFFVLSLHGTSQLPVEIFFGNKKSTADVMFFRYFNKSSDSARSRWLFFNRNRVSIDYRMTKNNHPPQFGFTEAVSYNDEKFKGFAPVLIAQVFNSGVFSKAGIQYASVGKQLTIFCWLVVKMFDDRDIDFFAMIRYTPALSKTTRLFLQIETLNTIPAQRNNSFNFIQRLRAGLQFRIFQIGAGLDLNQEGRRFSQTNANTGLFIRHEF